MFSICCVSECFSSLLIPFYADAAALALGQTGVRSWCKQQQQSRSSEGGDSRVAGEMLFQVQSSQHLSIAVKERHKNLN